MPLGQRFLRVAVELPVLRPDVSSDPGGLVREHQVGAFGRDGELGVDGGGERMHEIRPARVPQPQ